MLARLLQELEAGDLSYRAMADAILAAGFTRRTDQGETVARLEKELAAITSSPAYADKMAARERDAAIRERDEARAHGKVLVEANKRHFDTAVAIAAERDAAIRERDEARANHQRVLANNERLHAERDALAARLKEADAECDRRFPHDEHYEQLNDALAQRDAAIARAEAAERAADSWSKAHYARAADLTAAESRAEAAEAEVTDLRRYRRSWDKELADARAFAAKQQSRAAALAAALRSIANKPRLGIMRGLIDADVVSADVVDIARAALAANGTTTTAGEKP